MVVEEQNLENGGSVRVMKGESHFRNVMWGPVRWLRMLASELHWSFVFGVVSLYGINQGLGGSLGRVATEYYMKDVQKVQPSESQALTAITKIPWIIKPLWGILTDVLPIFGFHRRPYFILAGKSRYKFGSNLVIECKTSLLCFFCRGAWGGFYDVHNDS